MKNLKVLLSFIVITTFFILNSYSQGNKVKTWCEDPVPYNHWESSCLDEPISGSEQACYTLWLSKFQMKVKGTFVGDETGTIYYYSYVLNIKENVLIPGYVYTGTVTATIEDEYGNVFYSAHENTHTTINANGVVTAEPYNFSYFCGN